MEDLVPADVSATALMAWTWAADFLPRLASAIVLIIAGFIVAGWLSRTICRLATDRARLDPTIGPVLGAIVRYGILTLVAIAVLGQLGVQTTSLLAALGAIGLAIGLALQGTLSNIAAGFMLLWLRPFRVGEYIDNGTVAGTVTEIGLFATTLNTFDGLYRFVPNSELWNSALINYTRNPTRMTDMAIGIAYDADIAKAREILLEMASADERVADDPAPLVFVDDLGDSAVVLKYRVWITTADYWPTQRHLIEEAKRRFDSAGIEIPFPQRVVHMQGESAPPEPAGRSLAA
jgi:small conductance mechanosensitive channel